MMKKPAMNKRDRLLQEIAQRKAQLKDLEARERQKARKQDTRRKIIAGAIALEHGARDPVFQETLQGLLEKYVTRPNERALFNLDDPIPANEN